MASFQAVTFGGPAAVLKSRGDGLGGIVTLPPFQAEQAVKRVQQPVPASGARGFLEGNGRLVQELVE
jgi:hypothetical protein